MTEGMFVFIMILLLSIFSFIMFVNTLLNFNYFINIIMMVCIAIVFCMMCVSKEIIELIS